MDRFQGVRSIRFLDKIEVPVLAVVSGSGWLHSAGMLRGLSKIKARPFKVVVGPSIYRTMFSTMAEGHRYRDRR